ncbi:MAG: M50 family metallopeptidase [Pirellulaceae bacterium]|nr:M50 family metallopeptidase [Pirellulaceae bacterium]
MSLLARWFQRSTAFTRSWGRASVHISLIITLVLLSLSLLILGWSRPAMAELRWLAFSLPIVWVVGLTVRIAAQNWAVGSYSQELETRLGPSGNLATEYEYMPSPIIFRYALAGHLATFGLAALGLIVTATLLPLENTRTGWTSLLDVRGGWSSLAWATQILWVNVLLGIINLLPTIPFDNRALLYALAMRKPFGAESAVLRRLGLIDSHLASALLGCGLTILVFAKATNSEFHFGWYAVLAAAVYLYVASRWEASRAVHLEEQYMPFHTAKHEHRSRKKSQREVEPESGDSLPVVKTSKRRDSAAQVGRESRRTVISEAYLDEILRKLHREGTASLTAREQEALLTASQRLKEKRQRTQ